MMSILLFLDTYTPSMEELAMRSPSSLYLIDINQEALPQTRLSSNFYTFDSNPHASPSSFELMASVAQGQSRADGTPFRETSTILCSSRQERCAAVSGPPCGGVVFPFTLIQDILPPLLDSSRYVAYLESKCGRQKGVSRVRRLCYSKASSGACIPKHYICRKRALSS
jgi:hypothetical protein